MSEAATALQLAKSGQEASSYGEELEMLRESDGMHLEGDNGPTRDEGWKRGRLVGAAEEQRPRG